MRCVPRRGLKIKIGWRGTQKERGFEKIRRREETIRGYEEEKRGKR